MLKVTYKNIVEYFEKEFTEFKNYSEYALIKEEKELPYVYIGTFANFLNEEILKNQGNPLIDKTFHFINEKFLQPNSDPRLINLLAVEFFEHFTYSQKLVETAKEKLKGKALEQFYETLKWFKPPVDENFLS